MASVTSEITRNDFRVRPALFYGAFVFLMLGLGYGTVVDAQNSNTLAFLIDLLTAVGSIAALVFCLLRRMPFNAGLGILVYIGSFNFVLSVIQATVGRVPDFAANVMFNMTVIVVFMGIGGFVLNKKVGVVFGAITSLIFLGASLIRSDSFLLEELPNLLVVLIGYTYVLYNYRSSLENLIENLHETHDKVSSQRDEMKALKEQAEGALIDLQHAQTRIVAQEKLASLGSLTAGIAHEIKNPLNFITNFSESSIELMEELGVHIDKIKESLSPADREDVDYLLGELRQNMRDINEHGKRGDHIVKSMLMHSRSGSSSFTVEDLNALAEECLSLSYHGLRAQDSAFQSAREFSGSPELSSVEIVRGDMSRVLINMCNNAFYSVAKRSAAGDPSYKPSVGISLTREGQFVRIDVRDNGMGISEDVKEKLFQPFFTTKPTGEGTGLGLSMSHEIIVQEHGGRIEVNSAPGEGATFTVRIPLRAQEGAQGKTG